MYINVYIMYVYIQYNNLYNIVIFIQKLESDATLIFERKYD